MFVVCLPDTFKSNVSNTRCLPCPANSFSNFTESTECDCIEGWYRAEKDSPETDCTGKDFYFHVTQIDLLCWYRSS